nr:hypothetical protein [Tanacetum cinerariifolium]
PQGALLGNTIPNPRKDIKVITIRRGITRLADDHGPGAHFKFKKYRTNPIPDKLQDKSDIQIHKFLKMFKKLHFNISFTEALPQMPKYTKMLKDLLTNKEKLLELANTPLNENCSAVILKKLPEKIEDPGNFSFFLRMSLCKWVSSRFLLTSLSLTMTPTPSSDPVVASLSPSLTPFGDSDFLFEETDYFLTLDLMPLDIDNGTYDLEGDMLFLEKLLEDEPSEVEKSKINPLIKEPSDTFLMGDKEIKFNPLKDIDDPI